MVRLVLETLAFAGLERRAQQELRAGVVLMSTGAALGLAGLVLGLTDACTPKAGNSCNEQARSRAVWTMEAPAIAMIVGGSIYLGLAFRDHRRLATAKLVPVAGLRRWGLAFSTSF